MVKVLAANIIMNNKITSMYDSKEKCKITWGLFSIPAVKRRNKNVFILHSIIFYSYLLQMTSSYPRSYQPNQCPLNLH